MKRIFAAGFRLFHVFGGYFVLRAHALSSGNGYLHGEQGPKHIVLIGGDEVPLGRSHMWAKYAVNMDSGAVLFAVDPKTGYINVET